MRSKTRRCMAAMIALLMAFAVACDSDTGDNTTTTTPVGTTLDTFAGLQEEVQKYVDDPSLPDVEVTEKIKWLSWWELDENGATAELFKARYGVPDEENGENIIDYWYTSYNPRYEELAKRVVSNDSPDMFQFEERFYPWGVYANLFQTIDGVIDLSGPEWEDTAEAIALFNWGGKNYCAVTELVPSYFLWYRKSVVEEAGLDDPYTLYKAGQWDWNAFLEMAEEFSDPANDKYFISGWNPDNSLLCTTGVGLISLEDGKLQSNMYDTRIERAMEVIATLSQRNYRYPHHELDDWSMNYNKFRSGNILFWDNGQWFMSDLLKNYRDKDGWEDDELCFVAYPKDPNADKYYQMGKQDAFMLVSGSKNIEGYKAWIQCTVLVVKEPAVKEQSREKSKNDHGWTDTQLDMLDELVTDLVPVFDFKNGIGEDVATATTYESPVEYVTKYVYIHGDSYTQTREENASVIDTRIREMNDSLDG